MGMRLLFALLALGLCLIAYAAATNGQPVIGVAALAIGVWLATFARPRRRRGG